MTHRSDATNLPKCMKPFHILYTLCILYIHICKTLYVVYFIHTYILAKFEQTDELIRCVFFTHIFAKFEQKYELKLEIKESRLLSNAINSNSKSVRSEHIKKVNII